MTMRNCLVGAAAALMTMAGSASAVTTLDPITKANFTSTEQQGLDAGGIVDTFSVDDFAGDLIGELTTIAETAGVEVTAAALAPLFDNISLTGTFGFIDGGFQETQPVISLETDLPDPSTGLFCNVACALSGSPQPFSAELSTENVLAAILDGDEILTVRFNSVVLTPIDGVVRIGDLTLAFNFDPMDTTVIPLPATGVLLLGGLAALGAMRRRKADAAA